MFKRLKITAGVLGAFAALGLGGAAIAGATSSAPAVKAPVTTPAAEVTSGVDGDNIQSGDQNTPDTASAALTASTGATDTSATDTSATDAADAAKEAATPESTTPESTTPESATSEAATPNDGPGGYADTNTTADTQQQGAN